MLKFIADYIDKHGYAPSCEEICKGIGISSATFSKYFNLLIDEGYLESEHRGLPRAYRLGGKYGRT